MKKSAFSLIELLVVIAIIGILAVIAVPYYVRESSLAKAQSVIPGVNGIIDQAQQYANKHGVWPTSRDLGIPAPPGGGTWSFVPGFPSDPVYGDPATIGGANFANNNALFLMEDYSTSVGLPSACGAVGYIQYAMVINNIGYTVNVYVINTPNTLLKIWVSDNDLPGMISSYDANNELNAAFAQAKCM